MKSRANHSIKCFTLNAAHIIRRDGEESRTYLIECFETYVTRHTLEGFEAKGADQELDIIRRSVDTGSRTMADLDG